MPHKTFFTQGPHGGEAYALAHKLGLNPDAITDYSSNTHILAAPHTQGILNSLDYPFLHYPDTKYTELRKQLAQHHTTEAQNILPGNGSAVLIWDLFRWLKVQEQKRKSPCCQGTPPLHITFLGPIFSEYVRACTALEIPYTIITTNENQGFNCTKKELTALANSSRQSTCTVLCSPNNPAGLAYANLDIILQHIHSPYALADLAYSQFLHNTVHENTHKHSHMQSCLQSHTKLISLHSLTKFYCCPDLRLGYLIAPATLITELEAHSPPWSISSFTQNAACHLLKHTAKYETLLQPMRHVRDALATTLSTTALFHEQKIHKGVCFITAGLRQPEHGAELLSYLATQGQLVRLCDNIPGMPQGYIRMQARPEWEQLIASFKKYEQSIV